MPSTKVVDLLNNCSTLLNDAGNVRWSKAELLSYLNEGQRQVVTFRPDASVKNTLLTCAASSKQSLPADGVVLVEVVRNKDGRAITKIDRSVLDIHDPLWHEAEIDDDGIVHYVFDPTDPTRFYLYPKPTTSHQIEAIYSVMPDAIPASAATDPAATITISDIYANAILDYALYRAHLKDAEFGSAGRATIYLQAFAQAVGAKVQADGSIAANQKNNQPGA